MTTRARPSMPGIGGRAFSSVRRALASVVLTTCLLTGATYAQRRQPVDDIFLDHPSMDSNATTAPAQDARPVRAVFRDRAILDASIARAADGRWFLTGTPQRDGPKDGVRLWTSHDGANWESLGAVHAAGRRVLAPDIAIRGERLFLTFQDQDGCIRIAAGAIARPAGPYRESPCLVADAADPSLFIDADGAPYLLWAGGMIARLKPELSALAEAPRFLRPDPAAFAKPLPEGQDWPVRVRIGEKGAAMFRDGDRYVVVASEVTNRMRSPTEDVFMATAPTPYGPFTRRFLAVPHGGRTSIVKGADGGLSATYNPQCADRYAVLCEQVAIVPLEHAPGGRLRPIPSVLTEGGTVAFLQPATPVIGIRDPSVTRGPKGDYYLVGTTGRNREAAGELALWRSADLNRWTETRLTFDRAGLGRTFRNSVALWAPELRWVERDRTFYLAFSMMERGVGGKTWLYRSTTGRAEGPYSNVAPANLAEGIDGFVFEDADGVYLLWGGGWLGKLNAARDGFERPPVRLVDTDGENVGYEGNALARVGDRYVITGAEWNGPLRTHGTYDMMYGTAGSIWGPYSKRQVGAAHAGHGTVFQDRGGGWWTTMFGNDVTAPFRKKLGFVPLRMDGDRLSVREMDSDGARPR